MTSVGMFLAALYGPFLRIERVAIGDAAFCFDPLSVDGVVRAIESGIEAADLILHTSAIENFDRYSEIIGSVQPVPCNVTRLLFI